MAKCMDLHSADAVMQDVKGAVLNQGRILSNGNELKDYQDTMNKILFIENGMIDKGKACSCHDKHHHHEHCGKSIASITKSDSKGLIDTYTILYTDGSKQLFLIYNGKQGDQGPVGPAGPLGPRGKAGKSAYEDAVDHGYIGTVEEWLESIRGDEGKSAYEVAVDNGFNGTEEEFTRILTEQVVVADPELNKIEKFNDPSSAANAVKYVEQKLTVGQQQQARWNINAACEDELTVAEDTELEALAVDPSICIEGIRYTPMTLWSGDQLQARINIGAAEDRDYQITKKKVDDFIEKADVKVGDYEDLDLNIQNAVPITEELVTFVVRSLNYLNGNEGDLPSLITDEKGNLVDAINEIADKVGEIEQWLIDMDLEIFNY